MTSDHIAELRAVRDTLERLSNAHTHCGVTAVDNGSCTEDEHRSALELQRLYRDVDALIERGPDDTISADDDE